MLTTLCNDLEAECLALDNYVSGLPEADWERATSFFGWTLRDQILHLAQVDGFGLTSLDSAEVFAEMVVGIRKLQADGVELSEQARQAHLGATRDAIMTEWRNGYIALLSRLRGLDGRARMAWFGPDMSTVSFASARQMEVWAHGQDIYDMKGDTRAVHDRIRNICEIGVRTFRWSFVNRDLTPPAAPAVQLLLPSGNPANWPGDGNGSVAGPAEDFALVVTQRRPYEETRLAVAGKDAREWMRIAQCFAGAPQERAAPGSRPPIVPAAV